MRITPLESLKLGDLAKARGISRADVLRMLLGEAHEAWLKDRRRK